MQDNAAVHLQAEVAKLKQAVRTGAEMLPQKFKVRLTEVRGSISTVVTNRNDVCLHPQYSISTTSYTEAHQRATRRIHPGFTQAVCRDFPTTVEKETRDKEKWERTSETPASTVIPTTGRGRASRLFLFFRTKCRDNTCVHGSLLTFGNDTPLYGHPTGGLAKSYVCNTHWLQS